MKRIILIATLCLFGIAVYAQTPKKKGGKKHATHKVVKGKKRKKKGAAQPAENTEAANPLPVSAPVVDTAKKVVVVIPPKKHFDRPLDGYFKKSNITNATVKPFPSLREADVVYSKRIWREIDLREKMNQYLASPKSRLIDIIMSAIFAGELTAYDATPTRDDPDADDFAVPLSPEQANVKLSDSSIVDTFDKDGNKIGSKVVPGEFQADSLIKFRIKEDWVFDKQRSVFEPRIIGIAPMVKIKVEGLTSSDYQPAFWIYFPEARPIFVKKEVVSKRTDASGLSFDDVFMKRLFTSYIVKESNEKNERIKDYATGIDKLYESERIKKSLMDWEVNLWEY
jgi:gliding motility associated protien GldN